MSDTVKNIRLTIEYRGTNFSGWQIQKRQTTIQGEIVEAIESTTGEVVHLTGAGRTDAGVHALGQVANFRINHHLEPEKYKSALNHYLHEDIYIHEAVEVEPQFDSRRSALSKRYRYILGLSRSALYRNLRWEMTTELDFDLLKETAKLVVGEHDFEAFCVTASRKEDNRCRIMHSKWHKMGPLLVYEVRGNRFLHSMIRSLVGAMANVAMMRKDSHPENLTIEQFADIIHAPSGQRIVFTAPAHGLYLVSVAY